MVTMEPMETIHLYYEREEPQPPKSGHDIWVTLFSLLCFGLTVWKVCSIPPSLEIVTVPAHFLPLQRFTAAEKVIPTGIKIYPATFAIGVLTIYNGSFLSEQIPQGLILTATNGVEVTTDMSVIVPAGNPPNYGIATVSAHALISGVTGNIPAYHIANVENASIYIRNLMPFTGGREAYTIRFITSQDRAKALASVRNILRQRISPKMFYSPCSEQVKGVEVTWACQYITYTPPAFFYVVGFELKGKHLLLFGYFVARSRSVVR